MSGGTTRCARAPRESDDLRARMGPAGGAQPRRSLVVAMAQVSLGPAQEHVVSGRSSAEHSLASRTTICDVLQDERENTFFKGL